MYVYGAWVEGFWQEKKSIQTNTSHFEFCLQKFHFDGPGIEVVITSRQDTENPSGDGVVFVIWLLDYKPDVYLNIYR